jgi:hypothetical protein
MKQHRNVSLVAAVLLVAFACGPTATTADAQQGRPADVTDSFTVEGICAFPVLVELRGKAKAIALPGGSTLYTSPGLTATLTNLDDPTKQETLGITGAIRETALENGDVELVFTGRNLVIDFDPVAGFVITAGQFSVAFDAGFNITRPLSGDGQVIDVCMLLE